MGRRIYEHPETVIRWTGKESKTAARRLAVEHSSFIDVGSLLGQHLRIKSVPVYKHVGTRTAVASSNMNQEVVYRCAAMLAEAKSLKPIMRNKHVSSERKMNILQTYAFSKGFFQAGTWPALLTNMYNKNACFRAEIKSYGGWTRL